MHKLSRRTAIALPLALLPFAARAQFPEKPLRWLVGYPAGGGTDVLARLLAASMQPRLGQPVVIENRPGAATALAAEALVRAPPDGHTVMTADIGTLVFNPALYKRLPYDANADFRPLGLMGRFHLVLAVKAATAIGGGSFLDAVATGGSRDEAKIGRLYEAALARAPTTKELTAAKRLVASRRGDVPNALQDIWWAVLNSNEFILNH
jgi:tripartite-type tricarboxylate transporter receptor subunit TctC